MSDNIDELEHTGQWAILPAKVRYDKSLPPNAKLIYAEIAAKCNVYGYCFCSNSWFAERLGVKPDAASSLIARLEKAEYIVIDLDLTRGNKDKRKIALTAKPYDCFLGIGFKADTGFKTDTVSVSKPIPIENNNIKIIPPNPPRGKRVRKSIPTHEPDMFARFWKAYPRGEDKAGAAAEWDKLRPDRELMMTMSAALERAKSSDEWRRGVGIPYACRWLKNRRWEDEIKSVPDVPAEAGSWIEEEVY